MQHISTEDINMVIVKLFQLVQKTYLDDLMTSVNNLLTTCVK